VVGEWILEDSKLQAPPEESSRVDEPGDSQKSQPAQAGAIQAWLVSHIAEHLKVETSKIDVREPLARYGMDSVQAVNLAESLAGWLGRELSPTLAYEYPTIEALAQHLAGTSSVVPDTATMDTVDTTTAPKSNGRSIREELLVGADLSGPSPIYRPSVERQRLLEDYIREKVASVLKLSSSKLDTEQSLSSLGLDSLLAMELKNWIEEELGVQVPITIFLQEPSIAQFSAQLLDQLVITASTPSIPLIPSETQVDGHVDIGDGDGLNRQTAEQLLADLDQLSDEEVDALLSQISQENGWTDTTNGDDINQRTAEQLLADLDQLSDEEVDSLLSQMSQKEPD
jgi:acyl carrier protein